MNKSVFYLIAAAALAVGCSGAKQPTFTVKGTTDAEAESIILSKSGRDTIAVSPIVNGAFSLELPIDETTPRTAYIFDGKNRTLVFVENGTLTYAKSGDDMPVVAGTAANDAYQAYNQQMEDLTKDYDKLSDEEQEKVYAQYEQAQKDLFEQNTSNYLGLYQLQSIQYDMTGEELEEALAKLDASLHTEAAYEKLASRVDILKKTAVGQPYIDVTLADRDGNNLSLSSYVGEGKYVLLDFWASWCGPCMGELPYLLDTYAKFHSKGFEIFGVSLDSSKDKWTGAIDDNKMNWIHVSDLQYWQSAGAALYGVNSIPANYLIGPDGIIIAKGLRGEALAAKMAELLN